MIIGRKKQSHSVEMKYSLHRWENSSGGGKLFNHRAFVLGQEISYHIPYSSNVLNLFESIKLSNFAWSKQIHVVYLFINFSCQIIWLFWGRKCTFFSLTYKSFHTDGHMAEVFLAIYTLSFLYTYPFTLLLSVSVRRRKHSNTKKHKNCWNRFWVFLNSSTLLLI